MNNMMCIMQHTAGINVDDSCTMTCLACMHGCPAMSSWLSASMGMQASHGHYYPMHQASMHD